jgi:hypothetical protein
MTRMVRFPSRETRKPNDNIELLDSALNGTLGILKSAKDVYVTLPVSISYYPLQTVLP